MKNVFINNQKGFTLVEMMIVVAILGILAAFAIPNLVRSRLIAHDNAMRNAMKTFSTANESYRAVSNPGSYAPAISNLTTASPPYLDTTWTAATKYGFTITYTTATLPSSTYSFVAAPGPDSGLFNTLCIDQTGVLIAGASGVSGDATGCTSS